MWCKFPYNENFVVFAKKHAGGNRNLIINFVWPNVDLVFSEDKMKNEDLQV